MKIKSILDLRDLPIPDSYSKTFIQKACDFWSRVQRGLPNECWMWTGAVHTNGYGQFHISKKYFLAHRVAWELVNGGIPDGMDVLHHCDNTVCVNTNHLFLGDQAMNMADKCAKGRQSRSRGENAGGVKLTWPQVEEIRARRALGETQKAIASDYGIHPTNIYYITTNKTWIKDAS